MEELTVEQFVNHPFTFSQIESSKDKDTLKKEIESEANSYKFEELLRLIPSTFSTDNKVASILLNLRHDFNHGLGEFKMVCQTYFP